MNNFNKLKREKLVIHLIIVACIAFLALMYIISQQNIFLMINSRNSERRDSYSITLSSYLGDIQEQVSGAFYEHCIAENLGGYSASKACLDISLFPLEEIELKSIGIYYKNFLIKEYVGKQILDTFNIDNGQVIYTSDEVIILKKAEKTLSISLHKELSEEMETIRYFFLKAVLRIIGLCVLIHCIVLVRIRKYETRQRKSKIRGNSNVSIFLLLTLITIFVFAPYLLGINYFVFTMQDIANDSINQTYPVLLRQANELGQGGFSKWSFYYGLGGVNNYSLFNLVYIIFGPQLVKYMLGFWAAAYCLAAGMIFFQYTKLLDIPDYIKYIGTMSYAFCGCMIIRCSWQGYFKEVLLIAFVLYTLEKWIKENVWKYIPLSYGILFIFCGIYTSLIWTAIGFGYCFMRLTLQRHLKLKDIWKKLFLLLPLLGIAVLIAAYTIIPSIKELLNSTRVQTMVSDIGTDKDMRQFFLPYTFQEIAKSLSRIFSNTFLGINNFNGIDHWMSDVALYSGLFCILLIPQCFLNKKHAVWNGILYTLCAYYICFPTLRSFVNVFSSKYNARLSSFWINVILIYIGCYTLKNVIECRRCSKIVLLVTACLECSAIIIGTFFLGTTDSKRECIKAVFFLSILTLIILCYLKGVISKKAVKETLVIVCLCEIISISYPAINDRYVLTYESYEKNSYEDGTNALIEMVSKNCDKDFFRVNKSYQSVGMNDALYQSYHGTSSYLGGTTHSNYLLDFNDAIGVRNMYASTSYLLGYDGINSVNTMLGIKYNLSKDDAVNYGYQLIAQNENIYMSENKNYLPLGYTYDSVMAKSDYALLNVYDRRDVLLHSAIVEDSSPLLDSNDIVRTYNYSIYNEIAQNSVNAFDLNMNESAIYIIDERTIAVSANNEIVLNVKETEKDFIIAFIDMQLSSRSTAYVTYHYLNDDGTEKNIIRNLYLQIGQNNVRLDIPVKNLKSVTVRFEKSTKITFDNFLTYFADNDFYKSYDVDCENRRKYTLSVLEFGNTYIKGTVSVDSPQLLFTSIPYDSNWTIYVDGKETAIENCNIAFIGCFLESGEHLIEFCYKKSNPFFLISIVAVTGYLLALIITSRSKNRISKNRRH